MNVSTPTLITFVVYIAAMILIGFIAYRAVSYTHLRAHETDS